MRIVVTAVQTGLADSVPPTPGYTWECDSSAVRITASDGGNTAVLETPDAPLTATVTVKDSTGNVIASSALKTTDAGGFSLTPNT